VGVATLAVGVLADPASSSSGIRFNPPWARPTQSIIKPQQQQPGGNCDFAWRLANGRHI